MSNDFKKMATLTIALTLLLTLSTSVPVSAAISGSGSASGSGYTEFSIYSPSWSLIGHAEVTVSGAPVALSIVSPNGKACVSGGVTILNPGTNQRVGLSNTVTGTYKVRFYSTNGSNASVSVTLKDF
jgi:hypothetical protein